MRHSLWALALVAAVLVPRARAEDVLIPHFGRLIGPSSTGGEEPITGRQKLKFSLHRKNVDASNEDNLVWEQEYPDVEVANGLYRVDLGETAGGAAPIDLDDLRAAPSLWLEITIYPNGSPAGVKLTPRQRVARLPLAHHAIDASRLGGRDATDYLQKGEFESFKTALTGGSQGGIQVPWAKLTGVPDDFADAVDDGLRQVAASGALDGKGTGEEPLIVKERGISSAMLAEQAVGTAQLAAGAVGPDKIAPGAVGTAQLAPLAVATANLQNGSVTASKLAPDAVTPNAFADKSIGLLKIGEPDTTCSSGDVLKWNGNRWACGADAGGSNSPLNTSAPLTFLNGVLTLSDGGVGPAKVAANAVETAKIKDDAVTGAKIADASIGTDHLEEKAVTGEKVATSTLEATNLKSDDAGLAKVTGGAALVAGGNIGIGLAIGSGPAFRLEVAGPAAVDGVGTVTLKSNSVVGTIGAGTTTQLKVGDVVKAGNLPARAVTRILDAARFEHAGAPLSATDNNNNLTFTIQKPIAKVGALQVNATGNVGVGTPAPEAALDVRGSMILDGGGASNLFTGTGTTELNRYLHLLNSPDSLSASGLKAGGLLVADTYSYANPGKNDAVIKGKLRVDGAQTGACASRVARYEATCAAHAVKGGYDMYATVSAVSQGQAQGTTAVDACKAYVGNNNITSWTCIAVPYVYGEGVAGANHGSDVRPFWGSCGAAYGSSAVGYPWFNKDDCSGSMMACCVH